MSRKRRFDAHNEEAHEDWLLSYADMITLLMAFFIMLAAISKVDANLFEQVQSGMAKDVGNRKVVDTPLQKMKTELNEVLNAIPGGADAADLGTDDKGVVLNLDAGTMFQTGSAEVKPAMMPLLKELAATFNQARFLTYRVEIQGHTDDTPVQTTQFPSNFDLAAGRALAILRIMASLGVAEDRMLISSFGAFAPRVPNHTEDGTPLPANKALNRRVSVHVYPSK